MDMGRIDTGKKDSLSVSWAFFLKKNGKLTGNSMPNVDDPESRDVLQLFMENH